jgi:hypothetical protein
MCKLPNKFVGDVVPERNSSAEIPSLQNLFDDFCAHRFRDVVSVSQFAALAA